jgi:hypothetical protein
VKLLLDYCARKAMTKLIVTALIFLGIAIIFVACRKPSAVLEVGGIYSTDDGKGRFGVVKLLAYSDGICHVRVYKQKFSTRPTTIDVASLSLGMPGDPDGFGMGHIPLREAGFLEWHPRLITKTAVTTEELDGYNIWKQEGGGEF